MPGAQLLLTPAERASTGHGVPAHAVLVAAGIRLLVPRRSAPLAVESAPRPPSVASERYGVPAHAIPQRVDEAGYTLSSRGAQRA